MILEIWKNADKDYMPAINARAQAKEWRIETNNGAINKQLVLK